VGVGALDVVANAGLFEDDGTDAGSLTATGKGAEDIILF